MGIAVILVQVRNHKDGGPVALLVDGLWQQGPSFSVLNSRELSLKVVLVSTCEKRVTGGTVTIKVFCVFKNLRTNHMLRACICAALTRHFHTYCLLRALQNFEEK